MLVGGVVVEDDVDELAGRDRRLDGFEEADELLMPVALHVACDEAAGRAGCVECVAGLLVRPATISTKCNARLAYGSLFPS